MTRWTIAIMVTLAACGGEEIDKDADVNDDVADMGRVEDASADMSANNGTDVGQDASVADLGSPDIGPPGDMGTDAGADMGGPCSRNGLVPVNEAATWVTANNFFTYTGYSAMPAPGTSYDFLSFEIYPDFGGMLGPQTHVFPGVNYSECGTCLLIFADCMQGMGCDKVFLVDSGSVEVSASGMNAGDAFSAEFSDLVFSEVTVDPVTYMSTKVVGGETYCVESYSAAATTEVSN